MKLIIFLRRLLGRKLSRRELAQWGMPVVVVLAATVSTFGRPVRATFPPSASELTGEVAQYCLYVQATNYTGWHYLAFCPAGQTNLWFDTTNLPGNPLWYSVTTKGTNNLESPKSVTVLFDTNSLPPLPVAPLPPGSPLVITN